MDDFEGKEDDPSVHVLELMVQGYTREQATALNKLKNSPREMPSPSNSGGVPSPQYYAEDHSFQEATGDVELNQIMSRGFTLEQALLIRGQNTRRDEHRKASNGPHKHHKHHQHTSSSQFSAVTAASSDFIAAEDKTTVEQDEQIDQLVQQGYTVEQAMAHLAVHQETKPPSPPQQRVNRPNNGHSHNLPPLHSHSYYSNSHSQGLDVEGRGVRNPHDRLGVMEEVASVDSNLTDETPYSRPEYMQRQQAAMHRINRVESIQRSSPSRSHSRSHSHDQDQQQYINRSPAPSSHYGHNPPAHQRNRQTLIGPSTGVDGRMTQSMYISNAVVHSRDQPEWISNRSAGRTQSEYYRNQYTGDDRHSNVSFNEVALPVNTTARTVSDAASNDPVMEVDLQARYIDEDYPSTAASLNGWLHGSQESDRSIEILMREGYSRAEATTIATRLSSDSNEGPIEAIVSYPYDETNMHGRQWTHSELEEAIERIMLRGYTRQQAQQVAARELEEEARRASHAASFNSYMDSPSARSVHSAVMIEGMPSYDVDLNGVYAESDIQNRNTERPPSGRADSLFSLRAVYSEETCCEKTNRCCFYCCCYRCCCGCGEDEEPLCLTADLCAGRWQYICMCCCFIILILSIALLVFVFYPRNETINLISTTLQRETLPYTLEQTFSIYNANFYGIEASDFTVILSAVVQGLAFGQPYLAIGQRLEGPTTVNIKGRSNEQITFEFRFPVTVNEQRSIFSCNTTFSTSGSVLITSWQTSGTDSFGSFFYREPGCQVSSSVSQNIFFNTLATEGERMLISEGQGSLRGRGAGENLVPSLSLSLASILRFLWSGKDMKSHYASLDGEGAADQLQLIDSF